MKTLIDKLYDMHEDNNDEYQTLLDNVVRLESGITKCSDCKEIFDEYQTASGDLHSLVCRNEFRRGFRTGALIVFEIFGEGHK